jgi:hypothetical protein
VSLGSSFLVKSLFAIWPLGQKTALSRHFFSFSQLRSPTMLLQKDEKLTENSSFLPQAPNHKQALRLAREKRGGEVPKTRALFN